MSKDYSVDEMQGSVFHHSFLKQPEIREVARIQKLFYIGARNHKWIPLIRKIVRYNLGPIYTGIFFLTYFIRYMRESGHSFFSTLIIGFKHLKNY